MVSVEQVTRSTSAPHRRRPSPGSTRPRRWGVRGVRFVIAAASGVAVGVAFPPVGLVWLMPLGIAGLLVVTRDLSGRAGFGYGWVFGSGFMLSLLYWNIIVGYDAWIGLSLAEAVFYGLMGWAWAWLRGFRWWPLGVAAAWVGAELLRSTVPFGGLPWGRLAFGLVDTSVDRFGRLGGTGLVSFAVVLAVALAVYAIERWRRLSVAAPCLAAAVAVVAVSLVLPSGPAQVAGHTRVAAVQGDVPGQGLDPFAERRAVLHNHASATVAYAARVDAGAVPRPDLVIWPENSTDIDPFTDRSAYQEINTAVRAIGVPTLVGAVVDGPDAHHLQNMGIVWSPQTGPGQFYVKRHPVPFGEYIPFRDVLTKYISRLKEIPKDFAAGHRPGVMNLGGVTIGDVICFEVAYDGLVRDVVNGGAQLLVVQTNNATWAVQFPGQLDQQFAMSRYRAVETGRTVVIASTDGISGIIAPDGTVVASAGPKTRAVLHERVPLTSGITPGMRYGFWVDTGLSALALVLVGTAYFGRRQRRGRMNG